MRRLRLNVSAWAAGGDVTVPRCARESGQESTARSPRTNGADGSLSSGSAAHVVVPLLPTEWDDAVRDDGASSFSALAGRG
ncbi:unnamed protein product [Lampetra planeri]